MEAESGEHTMLSPWEPGRMLRSVSSEEIHLSRGFLRCRPERWFPGFGMQWLPLAHSLGVELSIVEAKPALVAPPGLEMGFCASVDDEPLGLFMNRDAAAILLEAVCPGAKEVAGEIVLEYLARRLVTSLSLSWSGPESSVVRFEPEMDAHSMRSAATVKLTLSINGSHIVTWLQLGPILVERLDGLWRRQIQSTARSGGEQITAHVEIAHLTVPPATMTDYLRSGRMIDLEVPVSDLITLVSNGQPWLPGRICQAGGNFCVEVVAGAALRPALPEGTNRLSIEFGVLTLNASAATEIAQVGALYDSALPIADRVFLVVNGETVGQAVLRTYQGRFAISVL